MTIVSECGCSCLHLMLRHYQLCSHEAQANSALEYLYPEEPASGCSGASWLQLPKFCCSCSGMQWLGQCSSSNGDCECRFKGQCTAYIQVNSSWMKVFCIWVQRTMQPWQPSS